MPQLTETTSLVCFGDMVVPPTIGKDSSSKDAAGDPWMILQYPGLPDEVWTEGAYGRTWIYTIGALGVLGIFFAIATWYQDSLQREGMSGLIVILAFFSWLGCNGLGVLTGLVAMVVASGKDRLAALCVTVLNVAPHY